MNVSKLDHLLRVQLADAPGELVVVVTFESPEARDRAVAAFDDAVVMPPRSMSVTLEAADVAELAEDDVVVAVKLSETAELLS